MATDINELEKTNKTTLILKPWWFFSVYITGNCTAESRGGLTCPEKKASSYCDRRGMSNAPQRER